MAIVSEGFGTDEVTLLLLLDHLTLDAADQGCNTDQNTEANSSNNVGNSALSISVLSWVWAEVENLEVEKVECNVECVDTSGGFDTSLSVFGSGGEGFMDDD